MYVPGLPHATELDEAEYKAQVEYMKRRFPHMSSRMIDEIIKIYHMDEDVSDVSDELKAIAKEARGKAVQKMKENQAGPATRREIPKDFDNMDFDEQTLPSARLPWDEKAEDDESET